MNGKKVFAWTVDTRAEMDELITLGVFDLIGSPLARSGGVNSTQYAGASGARNTLDTPRFAQDGLARQPGKRCRFYLQRR
jgi:hypothetical protein